MRGRTDLCLVACAMGLLLGCGARTALDVDVSRDAASPDAARTDAGPPDAGPPCSPAVETCNGRDDDCDGAIDERLGFGAIGDPIVVRPAMELGDDRCSTCALAFSPHAVSVEGGILVAFRLGFDGSDPVPNTFTRFLDHGALPRAPLHLLNDRNTTDGLRMATHPRGAATSHCGRFGFHDVATSALLDGAGTLIAERAAEPAGRSCGAWEPDVVWTGTRTLLAWTDKSTGPSMGFEVLLDRADETGASTGSIELEPNAQTGPRMAVGHGRVVLVADARTEPRVSRLAVHVLDLDGVPVGSPAYVEMPADEGLASVHVTSTLEGFAVHGATSSGGRMWMALDANGAPSGAPMFDHASAPRVNDLDDVLGRRDGSAVIAGQVTGGIGYRVIVVDRRGAEIGAWEGDATEGVPAWGALVEHRQRLFLTYAIGITDGRNDVRIRELGCVP